MLSSGKPILIIGILIAMDNEERTPFGRRLFEARTATAHTQESAARSVGMKSQSTLAEAEISGKRSGFTPQLAALYGVSPQWLATGKGEKYQGAVRPHEGSDDVTVIPRMNGKAKGGGGGLAPAHEYVIGSISVTNEWINRRLPSITTKRNLAVIEAYGRSMEPTLMSGDLLVVDTGVHDAKIDGIYILQRLNTPEPEIMVKRLQRTLDGGLIVRSDNRAEYDPETVPATEIAERVRIIGRVVWVWAGREA